MQKKIEKFGLFLTKTEDKSKSDKRVKCIYKNENVHTKSKKKKHGEAKHEKVLDDDEFLGESHKRNDKKQKELRMRKPHSQILYSPLEVVQKSKRIPKNAEISKEKLKKRKHSEKNHHTAKLLNRPIKAESNDNLLSIKHFHQTPSELKFLNKFFVLNKNFAGDNPKLAVADLKNNKQKPEKVEKNLQNKSKIQVETRNHERKEELSSYNKNNCVLAVDSVKCILPIHIKNNDTKNKRLFPSSKDFLPRNKHLSKISFSIVHIPSIPTSDIRPEKNKKLKKYYKYNSLERASEISACKKFSDSNKLYQNLSEEIDIASSIAKISKSTSKNSNIPQDSWEEFMKKTSKLKKKPKKYQSLSEEIDIFSSITRILESTSKNSNIPQDLCEEYTKKTSKQKKKTKNKEEVKFREKNSFSGNLRMEPNVSVFTIDASSKIKPDDGILVKQKKLVPPKSRIPILQSNLFANKKDNTGLTTGPIIIHSGTNLSQPAEKLIKLTEKQSRTSETRISSTISQSENSLQAVYDKKPKKMLKSKKFVAKSSISCSTFGDKSFDFGKNVTSLLLTKTYKDDDKMLRYYKRKKYSDALRSNWIGKGNQKRIASPQVLEVRFLTVTTQNNSDFNAGAVLALPNSDQIERQQEQDNIFNNDLPNSWIEDNIWENPELNDIMSENYNFLQKDFSLDIQPLNLDNLSISTLSNNEQMSLSSVSITSLDLKISHNSSKISKPKTIISQTNTNRISDESGYSSIKSNFFDRPDIKKLFTQPSSIDYSADFEDKVLSGRDLHTCSFESKSLQTISVAYSQKSVQIKLSEEELTDLIDFSDSKHLENSLNSVLKLSRKSLWKRLRKFSSFYRKICPVLCITKIKENES